MAIPTKPQWATTAVVNATSGQSNVVEPPQAKKEEGFDFREVPPRQYINWLFRQTYLGLEWTEQSITALESDVTALQNLISGDGSVNITDLQNDVAQLQTDVGVLQTNVTNAQADITTIESTLSGVQSDLTQLNNDLGTVQSNITTIQGQIATIQSNISQLQSNVSTLNTDMAKTRKIRQRYTEEISDAAGDVIVNIIEYENDEVEMHGTLEVGWKQFDNSSATLGTLAGTAEFIMSFQNMDLGMQRYSEQAANALEIKDWALTMQITGRSVNGGGSWAGANDMRHSVNFAELNDFNNRVFLQISTNFDFQEFVAGDKFIISFSAKSIELPTP